MWDAIIAIHFFTNIICGLFLNDQTHHRKHIPSKYETVFINSVLNYILKLIQK